MNRTVFRIVSFALTAALFACGSGRNVGGGSFDGGPTTEDGGVPPDAGPADAGEESVTLSGAVQKGPLVLGSAVSVSPLDKDGVPTGEVFQTTTANDLGEFEIKLKHKGLVSIMASGYYFNEVTGCLSGAPITLRALVDVEKSQAAFVNVITHVTYDRVLAFVKQGKEFKDASIQAESELRLAMKLGGTTFNPGKIGMEMDITGGDDAGNAYLFAVSAVLAKVAQISAPGTAADAQLQEFMNKAALDLADDGALSAANIDLIDAARGALGKFRVTMNMQKRLSDLGSTAPVPDLRRVFDTDGDGLVDAEDNCPLVANPEQGPVSEQLCEVVVRMGGQMPGAFYATFAADDVDGDGTEELVVVGETSGKIVFHDADGTTAREVPINDYGGRGQSAVQVADFDSDGKKDIVISGPTTPGSETPLNNAVDVFFGDDAGGFGTPTRIMSTGDTQQTDPCGLPLYLYGRICSLNGDEFADLVLDQLPVPLVYVADSNGGFSGNGTAVLPCADYGTEQSPGDAAIVLLAEDLDLDGNDDLLIYDTRSAFLLPLLNDGTGRMVPGTPSAALRTLWWSRHGHDFSKGDINGDGFADVVFIRGPHPRMVVVALNDGKGGFSTIHEFEMLPDSGFDLIKAVDFQKDGFDDIVALSTPLENTGSNLEIWWNTSGTLVAGPHISLSSEKVSMYPKAVFRPSTGTTCIAGTNKFMGEAPCHTDLTGEYVTVCFK